MRISSIELADGQFAGALSVEIVSIPDVSIVGGRDSDSDKMGAAYVATYRRDAENLLDPLLSSVGAITYSNNARGRIEGHNEMADKMREYAISQGHKADYTDGYNKMSSSENAQAHRDK